MKLSSGNQQAFIQTVWGYYDQHQRILPWRDPEPDGSFDPYKIMVSEIMLQQTQAERVISYYNKFITLFPSLRDLANASLADVLIAWQGLGYNRRAKYLHDAAKTILFEFDARMPKEIQKLQNIKGIGPNTAAAIIVYSYNQPQIFIETNIRSVYLHHFFPDKTEIRDSELLTLVQKTMDQANPRLWYWALMDYGVYVKKAYASSNHRSAHYIKQSKFHGSTRQLRGRVLRLLSQAPLTDKELAIKLPDERLPKVLETLKSEGLIIGLNDQYMLAT